jgi:hypothetical protein
MPEGVDNAAEFMQRVRLIMLRNHMGEDAPVPVDDVMFVVLIGMLVFHFIDMAEFFANESRASALTEAINTIFDEGVEDASVLDHIGRFKACVEDAEADDDETPENKMLTIVFLVRYFWDKFHLPEPHTEGDEGEIRMIDDVLRERHRDDMIANLARQLNMNPTDINVINLAPPAGATAADMNIPDN